MGIKQVYPGRYEPNALVRLYRAEKVSFSHCVPTILQQLIGSGQINKWAIPKQFKFVADIPKTSVGKINNKLIRENELAGR